MRKKEAQDAAALGKATIMGLIWTSAGPPHYVQITVKSFPNLRLEQQQEVLALLPKNTEWVQIYDRKVHAWVMTGFTAVRRIASNEEGLLVRVFPNGPSEGPLRDDECLGLPSWYPKKKRCAPTDGEDDEPTFKRSKVSPSSILTPCRSPSPSLRNAMSSPGPADHPVDKRPVLALPRQQLFASMIRSSSLSPIAEDDVVPSPFYATPTSHPPALPQRSSPHYVIVHCVVVIRTPDSRSKPRYSRRGGGDP
ncbi:hypothetical protein OF83DRAFT_555608 [Amylostereum chailletii]|nr:hypothetical protein OF83DRAFT_555608 [Amylostereum chailletii]